MYLDSVKDRFPQVEKRLIDLARIPSVTPPSDTKTITEYVASTLSDIPGVAVSVLSEVNPIVNVLASVEGAKGAGHTLLLNGHLDTFEVVTPENWQHAPFGGEVENRRIFGVGVSDMKAGCASLLETFILMAEHRDEWAGKLILTLVGGRRVRRQTWNRISPQNGSGIVSSRCVFNRRRRNNACRAIRRKGALSLQTYGARHSRTRRTYAQDEKRH